MKEQAEATLKDAQTRAKAAGVDVATDFEVGIPKQAISETLPDLLDTTLTVIGKSGVHGLNRAIMGSTTSYVVRRSITPVLVVGD